MKNRDVHHGNHKVAVDQGVDFLQASTPAVLATRKNKLTRTG
ncbi:hypothetical protein [Arthrobacter sp. EpRS71]|nr:hypothetical protein [Arthrobacter sp. EpRS71]